MNTEIPEELVQAQREMDAAHQELQQIEARQVAAQDRWRESLKRHQEAWARFSLQVQRQVQELVAPAGEGR